MQQPSLFSLDEPGQGTDHHTKSGDLKASVKKAIQWYAIDHGFKLTAASAYPQMFFIRGDGEQITANIEDVIRDYKDWKKRNYGKRQSAA